MLNVKLIKLSFYILLNNLKGLSDFRFGVTHAGTDPGAEAAQWLPSARTGIVSRPHAGVSPTPAAWRHRAVRFSDIGSTMLALAVPVMDASTMPATEITCNQPTPVVSACESFSVVLAPPVIYPLMLSLQRHGNLF